MDGRRAVDAGEEAKSRKREEADEDFVEDALQDDEFAQVLQLVPRDELKNYDMKKAAKFLAKQLSGSSKECALQNSVQTVSTVEGLPGSETGAPLAGSKLKMQKTSPIED